MMPRTCSRENFQMREVFATGFYNFHALIFIVEREDKEVGVFRAGRLQKVGASCVSVVTFQPDTP